MAEPMSRCVVEWLIASLVAVLLVGWGIASLKDSFSEVNAQKIKNAYVEGMLEGVQVSCR